MAIAFVQKAIGTDNVSGTTAAVTITAGGTGNLICGMVTCADLQTVSSVKDNNNVSATIVDTIDDTTNATRAVSFYFKNISGAPTTITATFSASTTFARIEVNEWSGIDTVAPLDGHAGQTSSGTSLTTQNYTTTADGNLLYGAVVIDSAAGSTLTAGSGYTLRNDGSGPASTVTMADESQIQSAHSSSTVATFGVNITEGAIVLGMAFKAAVATGGVGPKPNYIFTPGRGPRKGLSGTLNTQTLSTQSPFNQYDWPVPQTYIRPDEFYTFSNVLIISKQPASFGRNYDWPNTTIPKPIDQFYVFSNINQISRQPASFFNKYDYPNPTRVSWYLDWSQNLQETTL